MRTPHRAILFGGLFLFWAASWGARPACAWLADPSQSSVFVQAPLLAPGVWGSAPVRGELAAGGAFQLTIQGAQASTGSSLYDAMLHRTLGVVKVQVAHARLLGRQGVVDRYTGQVRVGAAGRVVSTPLNYRITRLNGRRVLNAFVVASLDAQGVRSLTGGPAGPVRVSLRVRFPTE